MDMTLYYFLIAWSYWSKPFEPLPYGDPYLAALALFFTVFFFIWRMNVWSPKDVI